MRTVVPTVHTIARTALIPELSVTVIVELYVPALVGVPLIRPVPDMDSPAGSAVAVQLSGAVPPEAAACSVTAVPTDTACPVVGLVTTGCATTVQVKLAQVLLTPSESVTVTLTV